MKTKPIFEWVKRGVFSHLILLPPSWGSSVLLVSKVFAPELWRDGVHRVMRPLLRGKKKKKNKIPCQTNENQLFVFVGSTNIQVDMACGQVGPLFYCTSSYWREVGGGCRGEREISTPICSCEEGPSDLWLIDLTQKGRIDGNMITG